MASSIEENHKHLLPIECYLSSETDEEESFVVLSKSLTPDKEELNFESKDMADCVRESLEMTSSMLQSLKTENGNDLQLPPLLNIKKLDESVVLENGDAVSIASSLSMDLSPEKIQQKIDTLIEENIKLKDTLNQNNLAMKKKYETLQSWHNEVQKVHESHKKMFIETKQYIEELKVENAQLKWDLQKSNDENKLLTEQLNKKMEECTGGNGSILIDLKESRITIEKLKAVLNKMKQEYEKNDEKQKTAILKSSFENVKQFEMEMNQKKIANLESQLMKVKEENEQLKNNSSELGLSVELNEANKAIEKLKMDIDSQNRNQATTVHTLLEENKEFKKSVEKANNINESSKEMHAKIMEQLGAAQMHITQLELLRKQDLENISKTQEEIDKLRQLNESKPFVDDDIKVVLQAQLELYKADFEAERHQKDTLKADKEQLGNELLQLQRRNQQLLEEVEKLRKGEFVYVEPVHTKSSTSAPQQESNVYRYTCPKCNFKFSDYQVLLNHVHRCIDLDEQLP